MTLELKSRDLRDHFSQVKAPHIHDQSRFYAYRWILQNDMYVRSKDKDLNNINRKYTNDQPRLTMLTGGAVYFTDTYIDDFFKKLALDFTSSPPSPNFFNQMAFDTESEGCRLAFDIDSDRLLNQGEIGCIMFTVRKTLQVYYKKFDQQPLPIFCAVNGPRLKKKKASLGIHIIVPVKVTVDQARQITTGFKIRLQAKAGKNEFNMTDIEVDASIYKDNFCNLRMIGSHKIDSCPLCDGNAMDAIACSFCEGRANMMTANTYKPFCCLSPEGKDDPEYFKEQHKDWITILKNHSLWSNLSEKRDDYEKPFSDPCYKELKDAKKQNDTAFKNTFSVKQRANVKTLSPKDKSYEVVEEFLQDWCIQGQYPWKDVVVSEIRTTSDSRRRTALILVKGPGSAHCMIADKDHGQYIYFKLGTNHKLTQGCHSEKHGCKGNNKIQVEVPGHLTNTVFGIQGPPKYRIFRKRTQSKSDRKEVEEFLKKKNKNSNLRATDLEKIRKEVKMDRLKGFYDSL